MFINRKPPHLTRQKVAAKVAALAEIYKTVKRQKKYKALCKAYFWGIVETSTSHLSIKAIFSSPVRRTTQTPITARVLGFFIFQSCDKVAVIKFWGVTRHLTSV